MGRRHTRHKFAPDVFVFPGGGVAPNDHLFSERIDIDCDCTSLLPLPLAQGTPETLSRALLIAGLRETFEETGYLAHPLIGEEYSALSPEVTLLNALNGEAVKFDTIVYLARAITPPGRPKRFDTRFFIAPHSLFKERRGEGDGELIDLRWVSYNEALELPLHVMTRVILEDLNDYMQSGCALTQPKSCAYYTFRENKFEREVLVL